jgi:hypothetical protein
MGPAQLQPRAAKKKKPRPIGGRGCVGCDTMPPCMHICCRAESTSRHASNLVLCRCGFKASCFRRRLNFCIPEGAISKAPATLVVHQTTRWRCSRIDRGASRAIHPRAPSVGRPSSRPQEYDAVALPSPLGATTRPSRAPLFDPSLALRTGSSTTFMRRGGQCECFNSEALRKMAIKHHRPNPELRLPLVQFDRRT